jgi:hypothetical protein
MITASAVTHPHSSDTRAVNDSFRRRSYGYTKAHCVVKVSAELGYIFIPYKNAKTMLKVLLNIFLEMSSKHLFKMVRGC